MVDGRVDAVVWIVLYHQAKNCFILDRQVARTKKLLTSDCGNCVKGDRELAHEFHQLTDALTTDPLSCDMVELSTSSSLVSMSKNDQNSGKISNVNVKFNKPN